MAIDKRKITGLKRETAPPPKHTNEPLPVTAGPIDKVVDLAFNPTKDKIREVTVIDRIQGRLLPQLDLQDLMWMHLIDLAEYRYDPELYMENHEERPSPPNLIEEFTFRTAQWQKSVGGKNLESAINLALAETENRGEEFGDNDPWQNG